MKPSHQIYPRAPAFFIVSAVLGGYDRAIFAWFVKWSIILAFFGFYRPKNGLK